jgi:hypothetical protein
MMPVDQQLAEYRNAILNLFVTNIPNSMMPVDQQLAGSRNAVLNAFITNIRRFRLTSLIGSLPDPGLPFSMRLLQISRIR